MMTFLARMNIKAGKEADFIRLANLLTENVRANEPETTAYQFYKLREGERAYAVYEQFTSEEAEEAHRNTAHFGKIAPDLIDCIDGEYVREFLDPME
jgi:quinol monooxygenase YgiN